MRTFIIGDIHGCYDELMALIEKVALTDDDLLIALGDIVDRGNKSKEVYEYLKKRPNTIVLIGNHERKHQRGILSYAQQIVKVQFGHDYDAFLRWLDTLGYYHETDDAIIVHAFFEHDKPLKDQKEEVLCGSTAGERYLETKYPPNTYWSAYYNGSKPIIYGHHVVGITPKILNNTYGIDTGCCHGDYLTAIELPSFAIHQVKAKADHWKEEQKRWQIPVLKAKNWNEMPFDEIDKQLAKLAYIEAPETRAYLDEISRWKESLQHSLGGIKENLYALTQSMQALHNENFTLEAGKLPFKTFLFKCRANNLKTEDLVKTLNTPQKLIELQQLLAEQTLADKNGNA